MPARMRLTPLPSAVLPARFVIPDSPWWQQAWTLATRRAWVAVAVQYGWPIVLGRGDRPALVSTLDEPPLRIVFCRPGLRSADAPSWRVRSAVRHVVYALAMPDGTLHHWYVPRIWHGAGRPSYRIIRLPPERTVPWPDGATMGDYVRAGVTLRA